MKYIVVGFKVKEENSIYYNKTSDLGKFHKQIDTAIEKGAEFISLRIVRTKEQKPKQVVDDWISDKKGDSDWEPIKNQL